MKREGGEGRERKNLISLDKWFGDPELPVSGLDCTDGFGKLNGLDRVEGPTESDWITHDLAQIDPLTSLLRAA